MSTASDAYNALKGVLAAASAPVLYQNEDNRLSDAPAPFVFALFLVDRVNLASYGGGRGKNRYRNYAHLTCYCFVPRGSGLQAATDLAESVAALTRSYRDVNISCFSAAVYPGGDGALLAPGGLKQSLVNDYFWASAETELFFDQIG